MQVRALRNSTWMQSALFLYSAVEESTYSFLLGRIASKTATRVFDGLRKVVFPRVSYFEATAFHVVYGQGHKPGLCFGPSLLL